MATLASATAIAILRNRAVFTADVLVLAPEIACVAARAIRHEGGRGPVDSLGVALVALGAQEVATVIERFVRQAEVLIDIRRPPGRRMAEVAFTGRDEVVGILSGSYGPVVARRAGTDDLGMVHHRYRGK